MDLRFKMVTQDERLDGGPKCGIPTDLINNESSTQLGTELEGSQKR
jgi:hypothetical protein